MLYLSDLFNQQDFNNMKPIYNYCFWSEPDSGKSRMILKHLVPLAEKMNKKILFLYNRKAIGGQLKKFKSKAITFMTYQTLETLIKYNKVISHYDYIVCDEPHYFVEDSEFNFDTELSFDFINNQKNSIIILLTGTPEPLDFIEFAKPLKIMKSLDHFNHNVEEIYLFRSTETIEDKLRKELDNNNKTLVFSSSAKRAYEMSRRFLEYDPYFICSESNKAFRSKCDEDIRQKIIEEEKSNRLIGFMTAAMNTGINFNEDIKNVVILGSHSTVAIRQTVARVRKGREGNRKVRLFVEVPHGQTMIKKINSMKQDLEYLDIGIDNWQKKYGRNKFPCYVWAEANKKIQEDAHLKINKLRLAKLKSDITNLSAICNNTKKCYTQIFEKYYPNTELKWLRHSSKKVEKYIREHLGKPLLKKEQEELKGLFKESKITSKNGAVGPQIIQEYLDQENKYYLELLPPRKINGKKQRSWMFQEKVK